MDIPQPPQDEELRNIIDKFAVFVARNGQEFESMTKQKQQGNPKFQFLYGGEYYNYYMYRVTSEQAILNHRQNIQNQQQLHQQQQQQESAGNDYEERIERNSFNQQQQFSGGDPRNQGIGHFKPPSLFDQRPFEQPSFMGGDQRSNFNENFDRRPNSQGFSDSEPRQEHRIERRRGFTTHNPNAIPNLNQSQNFEDFSGSKKPQRDFNDRNNQWEDSPPNYQRQQQQDFDRNSSLYSQPQSHQQQQQQQGNSNSFDIIQQQQAQNMVPTSLMPMPASLSLATSVSSIVQSTLPSLEALTKSKLELEEQIKQSENNLAGQQQLLLSQQQTQIEDALRTLNDLEIKQTAEELNVNLMEFENILSQVINSCTKDAISSGKAWIFTHTPTKRHYSLITSYLMRRATNMNATFTERLHMIYLVNDVLHHCGRKGAEDLQAALEDMVIPMFCFAKVSEAENEENLAKLDKLLNLWETKSNYVSPRGVEDLRNHSQTWLDYKKAQVSKHGVVVQQIANSVQQTYENYQNQHLIFCQHIVQNINQVEQQIQQAIILQAQQQQQQKQIIAQIVQQQQQQQQHQQNSQNIIPSQPAVPFNNSGFSTHSQQQQQQNTLVENPDLSIPDLSRPPPGFLTPPPTINDKDLIPGLPYFELPAGLMVPLVKPEDDNYKPIDPAAIRLPPPCPPNEKLLAAVEAFYAPPNHDRPRDSEGWEKLGLYEFFKIKNVARKQKEDDIREGRREKSRSPSPIKKDASPSRNSPQRRRYQSKSPPPESGRSSKKRRSSRSRSPTSSSSRSSRRSRRRSRSRTPPMRRSPTPPSFTTMGLGAEKKLDESNKGHQLLTRMGWGGGKGLGAKEQGIEEPISAGSVRDRRDAYKGVGINLNDPFESYRKQKGQHFIDRMRQRAEERN